MKNKSILFITSELVCGGAERMIAFLVNALSDMNYDVTLYSYEGNTSYYKINPKVKIIYEEKIARNYYTRRFIQLYQVRKKIKSIKPDIVISFLTNQNVMSIIGALGTKIPVIISERGDPSINTSLLSKIKYFFYNLANGIVFQTEEAQGFFNENIKSKSIIIPNPVPRIPNFEEIPYSARKNEIAYVARFEINQKRQDLMIDAMAEVVKRHNDIKLVFYGDGPDLDKIKKMTLDRELTDNIVFRGKVSNVYDNIKFSKLFVLTSDYEGIPNALIEAMSVGLPVVSTDCSPGGARLLIENNINGVLVPKGDYKAIANSVTYILDNPHFAEELGKKAKKINEKYSVEKIQAIWDNYIKKFI